MSVASQDNLLSATRRWLVTSYLFDCCKNHVSAAGGGQPVESAPDAVDGDHVQVLTPGVVGAVHHGTHGAGEGHAELGSRGSSTTSLRHPGLSANTRTLRMTISRLSTL